MKFRSVLTGILALSILSLVQITVYATTSENTFGEVETNSTLASSEEETILEEEVVDEEEITTSYAGSRVVLDESTVILEGVYAGALDLSGMTIAEATASITTYMDSLGDEVLTVQLGSATFTTTLSELGFSYDLTNVVENAATLGQEGGLIQRYKVQMDLKYDKVILDVPHSLSEDKVDSFIASELSIYDVSAVEATIKRSGGTFVVTQESDGQKTDAEATKESILTAVEDNLYEGNLLVEATVVVTTPTKTYAALSTISDLLGTYSTNYSSSASGRKTNIKVASSNINGTVLMPGESLSVSDAMLPRTAENGYALAGEYSNGETVQAYGGGVCQVATTLYNAVLRAELQIDKRYPHSMLVSYVDPSCDAAIASGSKDLVFTNNTENAIYIAASCDGSTLTFSIYGTEYRSSSHKIVFKSVVVSRVESESIVVYDETLPTGTTITNGTNHDKCTSYLVKYVYENGELVDTVQYSTDYYSASCKTITIGTGEVTVDEETSTENSGEEETAETVAEIAETEAAVVEETTTAEANE